MEIHIDDRDSITVYVKGPNGEVKTFALSYQEMMERGETIVDGLTVTEIGYLRDRKKIQAIKFYRSRTSVGLKDAKEAIEAWVERNHCCMTWPFCDHMKIIENIDAKSVTRTKKGLNFIWSYPETLTLEQVQALMSLCGMPDRIYGCYSYIVEDGVTKWASNCEQTQL